MGIRRIDVLGREESQERIAKARKVRVRGGLWLAWIVLHVEHSEGGVRACLPNDIWSAQDVCKAYSVGERGEGGLGRGLESGPRLRIKEVARGRGGGRLF